MHYEFNPAMEAIITDQYKRGVCDLPSYVIMLTGKLVYLERKHAKLEIQEEMCGHREEDYKRISLEKEQLENEIDSLDEELAYLIFKIETDAKNSN